MIERNEVRDLCFESDLFRSMASAFENSRTFFVESIDDAKEALMTIERFCPLKSLAEGLIAVKVFDVFQICYTQLLPVTIARFFIAMEPYEMIGPILMIPSGISIA